MSYILDALKRAEAERGRGAVPGLHAQPLAGAADSAAGPRLVKPALLLLAGIALALAGVALWRVLTEPATATPPAGVVATAPAVVVPPAAPAPLVPTTAPVPAAAPSEPAAPLAPTPVAAPSKPPVKPSEKPITKVDKPTAQTPSPAAAPAPTPKIPSVNDLPADVRQSLPKLAISGATYSDNPAFRMVIINGQVVREGERPLADLALLQIRPKSVVLEFRGQTYSVAY